MTRVVRRGSLDLTADQRAALRSLARSGGEASVAELVGNTSAPHEIAGARRVLRQLKQRGLVEYVGVNSFALTDAGRLAHAAAALDEAAALPPATARVLRAAHAYAGYSDRAFAAADLAGHAGMSDGTAHCTLGRLRARGLVTEAGGLSSVDATPLYRLTDAGRRALGSAATSPTTTREPRPERTPAR